MLRTRERIQDHMLYLESLVSKAVDVTLCGITFGMLLPVVYIKVYVRSFHNFKKC